MNVRFGCIRFPWPRRHGDPETVRFCLRVSASPRLVALAGVALALASPDAALAQGPSLRGFGDVGGTRFTASDTFTAVLGSPSGVVFGGGVEAVLPQRVFVSVRASRFQKDGTRVFVFGDEVFDLGIATTVKITPIELTAGYRFTLNDSPRLVPYAGGGIGWHRYEETSDFAADSENVKETHTGYHLLGGAEFRLSRWFGISGEAQWSTVADAIGQDPDSASAAFDETDLGGVTFRVKAVVGR
jgi:opacity protein-like surface antigen